MNNKWSMAIGLLIGVILGLGGVLATLHFTTAEVKQKQADAYDLGYKAGVERASKDGVDISGRLNQGAVKETLDLRNKLDTAHTRLQAFQSRADLSPQAQDEIALIIDGLK